MSETERVKGKRMFKRYEMQHKEGTENETNKDKNENKRGKVDGDGKEIKRNGNKEKKRKEGGIRDMRITT